MFFLFYLLRLGNLTHKNFIFNIPLKAFLKILSEERPTKFDINVPIFLIVLSVYIPSDKKFAIK